MVLGGGGRYFVPASAANEWGRPDQRDLMGEAEHRGYKVVRTRDQLNRLSTWRMRQVFGIFAPDDFYFSSLQPKDSNQPSLADMTRSAISVLNYSISGYFLRGGARLGRARGGAKSGQAGGERGGGAG